MNNEPVAWMLLGLEDRKPKLINLQVIDHIEGTWIPLYSHPYKPSKSEVDALLDNADYVIGTMREEIEKLKTKTLTDEEIEEAYRETNEPVSGIGYNMTNGLYAFARAILRKAQEK